MSNVRQACHSATWAAESYGNSIMAEKEPKTGDEMQIIRKRRNLWVLGMIFGLALLFYVITIFRMGV